MKKMNISGAGQQRFFVSVITLAVQTTLFGTMTCQSLHAVTTTTAQTTQHYQINAGSLDHVLNRFASQAKVSLTVNAQLTTGKTSTGLNGLYTVEQGFTEILKGSDLGIAKVGNSYTLILRPKQKTLNIQNATTIQPSNETVQLPVITVIAEKDQKETEKNYTVKNSSSATKLNLSLKNTPQSVTVITQKQMEDQNLTQAVEVLEQAPGVIVESFGVPGAGQARYYARGFEITNLQIDGMATTSGGLGLNLMGALDTGIYEQVDVVRGSTGLMAGVGDPSASINFKRKRPTEDVKGSVAVSYGSWNRLRSQFDVSGGLNEDNSIRGRMVAIYATGDHYIDRVDTDTKTLYGIVETDLGQNTMLSLGATYSDQHINGAAPHGAAIASKAAQNNDELYISNFSRSFNPATQWTYSDTQIFNGFAELAHNFNDNWKINLNYNYSNLDNDRLYGSIASGGLGQAYYNTETDKTNFSWGRTTNDGNIHNLDLFLSGAFEAFGQKHDVILGLNGYQGKMNVPRYVNNEGSFGRFNDLNISEWNNGNVPIPMLLTPFGVTAEMLGMPQYIFDLADKPLSNPIGWSDIKEKQYGGYFAARLKPIERLSVILGTRYNKWERNTSIYTRETRYDGNMKPYIKITKNQSDQKEDGKFIPYAGIVFDLNKDITAYASYTGIYKPHIHENAFVNNVFGVDGKPLPAIEGNSYEIGLKAGFFDNALNLHLAAFRMQQENMSCQASYFDADNNLVQIFNPYVGYEQSPAAICDGVLVQGGEFTITGAITPNWLISAGYTYVPTKEDHRTADQTYKMIDGKYILQDSKSYQDLDGRSASYFQTYDNPEHLVKLFSSYKFLDKFTIGGSLIWKSKLEYNEHGYRTEKERTLYKALSQDAYTVVDLMGRYQVNDNLTFGLNIKNVFDEKYRVNYLGSYFGEPRNFMATLQLKY